MKHITENILERFLLVEEFVNKHKKTTYFNERYNMYRIHCGIMMALDLALQDCNLLDQFNNEHPQQV